MTRKLFIIVLSLTLIICCNQPCNYDSEDRLTFLNIDSSLTIINDTSQIKMITKSNCFWIPTKNQLITIDSILDVAKNDTIDITNKDFIIRDLKKYYKQFICFKDTNGDSIAFINGFCQIPINHVDSAGLTIVKKYDWKNNLILMLDGGACYWQIKINLTKKIYYDFIVNGEA